MGPLPYVAAAALREAGVGVLGGGGLRAADDRRPDERPQRSQWLETAVHRYLPLLDRRYLHRGEKLRAGNHVRITRLAPGSTRVVG